jgi:hypothetical protein
MKYKLAVAASLLIALGAFGGQRSLAQQTVQVQFEGGGSGRSWHGDETGIYTATVGDAKSTGVVCDDYADTVWSGETWSAKAYQVSTLVSSGNLGNTLFGNSIGVTGYAEVATLVEMLFNGDETYGSGRSKIKNISAADLSEAIWAITGQWSTGSELWKKMSKTAQSLVTTLKHAFTDETAKDYLATLTDLWILTPSSKGTLDGKTVGNVQELFVVGLKPRTPTKVPEGGVALMYLLMAAIFCGGAMFFSRPSVVKS